MPDPTSAAIHAVTLDQDLLDRIAALAAMYPNDIPDPASWVAYHIYKLAVAPVDSSGENTVASVYDYARNEYRPYAPNSVLPGLNPAAVTDVYLKFAIQHVIDQVEPTPPPAE